MGCTRVGSVYSLSRNGVVQCSNLGPLLFIIYINDLTDMFKVQVRCKLFADDVKLCTEISCATDVMVFQECLGSIYRWSSTWQLAVSSHKCCVMDIGRSTVICDRKQSPQGTWCWKVYSASYNNTVLSSFV